MAWYLAGILVRTNISQDKNASFYNKQPLSQKYQGLNTKKIYFSFVSQFDVGRVTFIQAMT